MLKGTIITCLIAGILVAIVMASYSSGQSSVKPITIETTKIVVETVYETIELPAEIIEIEKVVVFTEYIDKLVEVPVEVTREIIDWSSKEELKAFLERDKSDEIVALKADEDGVIEFNGQCEDRALLLIKNAQVEGKRLFFIPLHRVEYSKWYGETLEEGEYHAIAGALVGDNEFWYIEPSDDKCWLALYLD